MTEPIDVEATLREHLTECAALRVETNGELRALRTTVDATAHIVGGYERTLHAVIRLIQWVAGIVVAAAITGGVGLFISHQDSINTTNATAAALAKYTASDAARDRAQQDAVNRQILDQLAKLSKGRH